MGDERNRQMKLKSVLAAAAAFVAIAASATEANLTTYGENRVRTRPVTPISANLVTPIGIPWGDEWDIAGLQTGIYNRVEDFSGLQIGIFNVTDYFCGLQVGVVNVTRRMQGIQLGLVNVISESDLSFMPLINWYF